MNDTERPDSSTLPAEHFPNWLNEFTRGIHAALTEIYGEPKDDDDGLEMVYYPDELQDYRNGKALYRSFWWRPGHEVGREMVLQLVPQDKQTGALF